MISRSKQNWTIGATVKVGFLTLTILAAIPTPGDYRPDQYVLRNAAGSKFYAFTPHHGVEGISADQAAEMIRTGRAS